MSEKTTYLILILSTTAIMLNCMQFAFYDKMKETVGRPTIGGLVAALGLAAAMVGAWWCWVSVGVEIGKILGSAT